MNKGFSYNQRYQEFCIDSGATTEHRKSCMCYSLLFFIPILCYSISPAIDDLVENVQF